MAHFAELDNDNNVLRVVVIGNQDCLDSSGNESEEVGKNFCETLFGGRWIKTSYNGSIRKQYAGPGYVYNQDADVFVAPRPYNGWILDPNFDWQPPTPKPEGEYYWSEDDLAWLEVPAG